MPAQLTLLTHYYVYSKMLSMPLTSQCMLSDYACKQITLEVKDKDVKRYSVMLLVSKVAGCIPGVDVLRGRKVPLAPILVS